MPSASNSVAPLDKVTLRVQVGSGDKTAPLPSAGSEVSFICGIGPTGLSPFEQMLCDRPVGDRFSLPIENGTEEVLFGHLSCMMSRPDGLPTPCELDITILSAAVAESRDVVKAMAQMTGGCGGDCDCGCGC